MAGRFALRETAMALGAAGVGVALVIAFVQRGGEAPPPPVAAEVSAEIAAPVASEVGAEAGFAFQDPPADLPEEAADADPSGLDALTPIPGSAAEVGGFGGPGQGPVQNAPPAASPAPDLPPALLNPESPRSPAASPGALPAEADVPEGAVSVHSVVPPLEIAPEASPANPEGVGDHAAATGASGSRVAPDPAPEEVLESAAPLAEPDDPDLGAAPTLEDFVRVSVSVFATSDAYRPAILAAESAGDAATAASLKAELSEETRLVIEEEFPWGFDAYVNMARAVRADPALEEEAARLMPQR